MRLHPPSTALCVPRISPPPLPTAATRHNAIAEPSLPSLQDLVRDNNPYTVTGNYRRLAGTTDNIPTQVVGGAWLAEFLKIELVGACRVEDPHSKDREQSLRFARNASSCWVCPRPQSNKLLSLASWVFLISHSSHQKLRLACETTNKPSNSKNF